MIFEMTPAVEWLERNYDDDMRVVLVHGSRNIAVGAPRGADHVQPLFQLKKDHETGGQGSCWRCDPEEEEPGREIAPPETHKLIVID